MTAVRRPECSDEEGGWHHDLGDDGVLVGEMKQLAVEAPPCVVVVHRLFVARFDVLPLGDVPPPLDGLEALLHLDVLELLGDLDEVNAVLGGEVPHNHVGIDLVSRGRGQLVLDVLSHLVEAEALLVVLLLRPLVDLGELAELLDVVVDGFEVEPRLPLHVALVAVLAFNVVTHTNELVLLGLKGLFLFISHQLGEASEHFRPAMDELSLVSPHHVLVVDQVAVNVSVLQLEAPGHQVPLDLLILVELVPPVVRVVIHLVYRVQSSQLVGTHNNSHPLVHHLPFEVLVLSLSEPQLLNHFLVSVGVELGKVSGA
mmetsp:Transcript_6808/g.11474  ORF Transcript_6808/g.11474 Transcript_6808/m.11474 type:complete len:314 (-) Transcript_6808:60-1001(-)